MKSNHTSLITLLCFIALHSCFCLRATAQNFSVDWYKFSGGGGTSTGASFSVSGTIGQPDATANSALTGGNFSLTGGFWSLYAVQQAGFPTLYIHSSAPNTAVVFWQNIGNCSLQTNGNLATTNWGDYGGSIALINGTNNATFAPATGNRFFRLRP